MLLTCAKRIIIFRLVHANKNYWSVSKIADTKTKTTSAKTKTAKFRSRAVSRPRPQSRGLHLWCTYWQYAVLAICMCVHVMQLLCESVQHSDVLQTMQLVFSGADVSSLFSLCCCWIEYLSIYWYRCTGSPTGNLWIIVFPVIATNYHRLIRYDAIYFYVHSKLMIWPA